ncbi:hypothetical protein Forpe1208_v009964 [Fusarium oxysporum f. sp. rapae]|uniref:DUF7924 domain-containing protein n=1 Tax=Fusarium oxysporum f. sp. rapae TaxID=485398 RepID=A0A8J5NYD6_FUSOX|nr:hypothetical protein Forpe1208_v009964 [Fusarium oxysporum f. sp. rapae]
MDGSLEPAPIKATPDNPKKRIASRSPSISPSQAQQLKKICHEDDDQGINDHVMFKPAPIRSIRQSAALMGYIRETQPRPSYLEQVDNWLEDIYPPDLRKISRSDCFILDKDFEPILLERSHSAPAIMSALVESLKKGRSSPEPTPQDNDELYDMEAGASEAKVEDFVRNNVIPPSSGIDKIKRSDRVFVGRAIIPITNPYARISVPVPDLLYGYRLSAFEQDQRMQIATCGNFAFANSEGLTFPFFAVEFKGDGPSSKGSL